MVDFGNTLKKLRVQNDYTQAQLAKKLGITKSVISAYETGLRMPSYDILYLFRTPLVENDIRISV